MLVRESSDSARSKAEALGCRPVTARDTPDRVIIATPTATHLNLLREYQGVAPILVEKPLGLDTQIRELDALSELHGDSITVGYMMRYHPMLDAIARLAPSGAIVSLKTDMQSWPGTAGRGDMLLECSHEIDLLLRFGLRSVWPDVKSELRGRLTPTRADFSCGRQWKISINAHARTSIREGWAKFDNGRMSYRFESATFTDLYIRELEDFLLGPRPSSTACTLEEGLDVLRVISAIRRSHYD